jgi:hypothetical protein
MRLARTPSRWYISVPLCKSQCHTSRLITEHRFYGCARRFPDQRPYSSLNGIQSTSDHEQRPTNTGVVSDIVWPGHTGVARGDSCLNSADCIQDELLGNGHRIWGFVIYRCTYGDDSAWQTCLERIHTTVRRHMAYNNALDMLENHELTVIEDARKFDHASAPRVREHFKGWRRHAVRAEQGAQAESDMQRGATDPNHNIAVRYKFCIQIDQAALQSIVSTEGGKIASQAWVNLIEADWDPDAAAAEREEDRRAQEEDPNFHTDDIDDVELFFEIDGSVENNVGWMRVRYQGLIPGLYAKLTNPNALDYMYVRPPEMFPG